MHAVEETFVRTFITKRLRDRWLTRLQPEKTRTKLLHKLGHVFVEQLDPRFVYDKDNPPPDIARQIQKTLAAWKKANPEQLCHIMAASERDGQTVSLRDVEQDYWLTFGAVIIIIPDKLAYYHTERSNLSKHPFYVLFRP
jgi:hypothetical protein